MASSSLKLHSNNAIYTPGEIISGILTVIPPGATGAASQLQSVKLSFNGGIYMHGTSRPHNSSNLQTSNSPRKRRFTQTTFLNAIWSSFDGSILQEVPLIDAVIEYPKTNNSTIGTELNIPPNISFPSTVSSTFDISFSIPLKAFKDLEEDKAKDLREMYGIHTAKSSALELLDTYHGASIDISYLLKAEVRFSRNKSFGVLASFMKENNVDTVLSEAEIFIRNTSVVKNDPLLTVVPYPFVITEEISPIHPSASNVFSVHGYINNIGISSVDPISGWIQIEQGGESIQSISIRLNRIERIGVLPTETTEIVRLDIVDGPIPSNDSRIPIFLVQPPWLTCPTLNESPGFSVCFDLVLIIKLNSLNKPVLTKAVSLQLSKATSVIPSISKTFGLFTAL